MQRLITFVFALCLAAPALADLTPAQRTTLKADILADGSLAAAVQANDHTAIAEVYNAPTATNVWRPDASVDDVRGAINWANLTPADAPNDTTLWANRAMACQGRQHNVMLLLDSSDGTLPADMPTFRAGLQDALTSLPCGVGGASVAGGWPAVQNVLRRPGTRLEVLFSSVDGTARKSSVYGYQVTPREVFEVLSQ